MTVPTGDDTARLGYAPEPEASLIARKAMRLLPAAAVLDALREGRHLTGPEVDALMAVEESTDSARALLLGLLGARVLTTADINETVRRWPGLLRGEG